MEPPPWWDGGVDPPVPSVMPSPSHGTYTPGVLRLYDAWVLTLSNRWEWRCPSDHLLAWYGENVGARHLDVGPGTGWFLARCRFPVPSPDVTLLDANEHCLEAAARRIARWRPVRIRADATQALPPTGAPFHSVGTSFVLHCLPGPMARKVEVLERLAARLWPGGRLFGATIVGRGVRRNAAARLLMRVYNRRGIFDNESDDADELTESLRLRLDAVEVRLRGMVALFRGEARGGTYRTNTRS